MRELAILSGAVVYRIKSYGLYNRRFRQFFFSIITKELVACWWYLVTGINRLTVWVCYLVSMIALAHLVLLWSLHHNLVYLHDLTTDSQTAEKQIISRWHLISKLLRKQVVSSRWAGFCCLLLLSVWVLGWDHSIVGIQRWRALGGVKQLCKRAAIITLLPEVGNKHGSSCVRSVFTGNERSCSIKAVDTSEGF